jgi:hypothetical protein
MDPLSAISVVAALTQLTGQISGVVVGIDRLHTRYKDANLGIGLLGVQLSTLKAALGQITEWVSTGLTKSSANDLLVQDLYLSIESCQAMMVMLDKYIGKRLEEGAETMKVMAKLKFAFDEKTISGYTEQLRRQIEALHFLLTAFHW